MRDTIDMARKSGGRAQQNKNCDIEYLMSADALKAFEALVRADAIAGEREACAKAVENYALGYAEPTWAFKLTDIIRARGQRSAEESKRGETQ